MATSFSGLYDDEDSRADVAATSRSAGTLARVRFQGLLALPRAALLGQFVGTVIPPEAVQILRIDPQNSTVQFRNSIYRISKLYPRILKLYGRILESYRRI